MLIQFAPGLYVNPDFVVEVKQLGTQVVILYARENVLVDGGDIESIVKQINDAMTRR